ncbi:MAG: hypothetical protein PHT94_05020 [Candidatus Nanoarchaeia archaeon]|nr:hypothetical protein [Candidatus Nanoarchaeia archaeon]
MEKTNFEEIITDFEEIEFYLDNFNAENGTKEQYCVFCKSITYDGKSGIIHNPGCIIKKLRQKILNLKNETKIRK